LFTEWTNELQFYAKQGALKKVNKTKPSASLPQDLFGFLELL